MIGGGTSVPTVQTKICPSKARPSTRSALIDSRRFEWSRPALLPRGQVRAEGILRAATKPMAESTARQERGQEEMAANLL